MKSKRTIPLAAAMGLLFLGSCLWRRSPLHGSEDAAAEPFLPNARSAESAPSAVNEADPLAASNGQQAANIKLPLHPRTGMPAACALWETNSGTGPASPSQGRRSVTFALWADGSVIWKASGDGSPHYMEGHLRLGALDEVEKSFAASHDLSDPFFKWFYSSPDSATEELSISLRAQRHRLVTSHFLAERSGAFIGTSHGVRPLGGDDPSVIASTWTREYRAFREAWLAAIAVALGVIHEVDGVAIAEPIEWRLGESD